MVKSIDEHLAGFTVNQAYNTGREHAWFTRDMQNMKQGQLSFSTNHCSTHSQELLQDLADALGILVRFGPELPADSSVGPDQTRIQMIGPADPRYALGQAAFDSA